MNVSCWNNVKLPSKKLSKMQEEKRMSQMTFSDYKYSLRKRKTKREEFLDIMNEIIPWEEWVEFVRPYYPNGKRGRPTKGIEKMLRIYRH